MIAMVEVADINNAYGNPVAELVQTSYSSWKKEMKSSILKLTETHKKAMLS